MCGTRCGDEFRMTRGWLVGGNRTSSRTIKTDGTGKRPGQKRHRAGKPTRAGRSVRKKISSCGRVLLREISRRCDKTETNAINENRVGSSTGDIIIPLAVGRNRAATTIRRR